MLAVFCFCFVFVCLIVLGCHFCPTPFPCHAIPFYSELKVKETLWAAASSSTRPGPHLNASWAGAGMPSHGALCQIPDLLATACCWMQAAANVASASHQFFNGCMDAVMWLLDSDSATPMPILCREKRAYKLVSQSDREWSASLPGGDMEHPRVWGTSFLFVQFEVC